MYSVTCDGRRCWVYTLEQARTLADAIGKTCAIWDQRDRFIEWRAVC